MKREKKQNKPVKTITPDKKNKNDKIYKESKQRNYFNIWTLTGLIIIIGIFAFKKYLTGDYLFFFKDIGSDSINQIYPGLVHKMNLLHEVFFSKWSFYKGMGDSWITRLPMDPYGIFRSIEQFASAQISGINSFVYGRFIRIFIYQFLLAGIVTYLFFRTLSINKFASVIGGLLIAFSGYMVVGSGWGFSSQIFKAVFLLFAFEQLYLKKRWYFFPFAIIWLSANVYVLFIYSVFLLIWSCFRYFSENGNNFKGWLRLTGKMIFLGFIGLMMNFAQVLSSFLKMFNSPRVAGDASYSNLLSSGQDIAEHGNLAGTTILRFFSSDIIGTGSNFHGWFNYLEAPLFYIGLLTLLFFPQIFIHLNKRKKIIYTVFLGFWISTLFFPYLRYMLLAFTGDYFRYGFDFFIPFTLLFFSIFALNEAAKNFKINIPLLIASLIVLFVLLFFPYGNISSTIIDRDIRKIIVFLLILYTGLLILLTKPKYKMLSQFGIIILVIFELSYFSYKSYAERVPVTKAEFNKDKGGYADGSIKAVEFIKSIDKTPFYRTEKDYQSGNAVHGSLNDALAQGYYGTTSYASFNQLNYVRFLEETGLIQKGDETATRWITGFRGYPLLQTFGNVKYHLSKSTKPKFLKFGFDSITRKADITILKNKYYLPFGYTYDKYIDFEDYKTLLNYQITVQSLNSIFQDLSRTTINQTLNPVIEKLKPILYITYSDYKSFSEIIKNQIGKEDATKYLLTIAKYSISNFKNQEALLSGFVFEKEFNKDLDLSEFKKILPSDSSEIMPSKKFNFESYKAKTDKLKEDTLQITSFKQSKIEGKINLSKTKMLFFTIPYDKGWKIKVDDKSEKLSRINIGFTGILLPKGNHTIKLYFIPQYSKLANTITLFSVVIFWLYLIFFTIKKRKLKKQENKI